MDLYWIYLVPLCVVCLSSLTGGWQMIRTALALFINYWVNTAFVLATEIYDPWFFYMGTDAITAWVVLYRPANRYQSLIGWSYIAQEIFHVVYGASKFLNPNFDQYWASTKYWQILLGVAFFQLLILGGWLGGRWRRRYLGRSSAADVAYSSSSPGLAER